MSLLSDETVFEQTLLKGAELLGIPITQSGLKRLKTHREHIMHWSSKVNLTTILDPQGMAELLYLDSACLVPFLDQETLLHDVGTGAGFPGLVLKAISDNLRITLSEARRKKVVFLKQAAFNMGLTAGLEIQHTRIGWQKPSTSYLWTDVVSRAAFPPEEWMNIGTKLLAPGGRLWFYFSGILSSQEDWNHDIPSGYCIDTIYNYRLPVSGKDRCLVGIKKL